MYRNFVHIDSSPVLKAALCLLLFMSSSGIALAQLPDPTKPPSPSKSLPPPAPLPEVVLPEVEPKRRAAPVRRRAPPLVLNSILIGNDRALAVVNGAVVRVGQRVSGATVLRIAKSGVTLKRGGREVLLRFSNSVVKRRVAQ